MPVFDLRSNFSKCPSQVAIAINDIVDITMGSFGHACLSFYSVQNLVLLYGNKLIAIFAK